MPLVTPLRGLKAYLEPDQVERLIWRTGIQVGELIALRVQDIDRGTLDMIKELPGVAQTVSIPS